MSAFLIPLFIIGLLVLANGLGVAAEFCMINIRPSRIEKLVEQGDKTAITMKKMLNTPSLMERYVATAQLGTTMASLALGMYTEYIISSWLPAALSSWLVLSPTAIALIAWSVAIVLVLTVHIVVGEMVPRSLALQQAEETALGIHWVMWLLEKLLLPLVLLTNALGNSLLWVLRIPRGQAHRRLYSSEELEMVVTESHRGGLLSDDEWQIIQNIFGLDERRVGQVMTPRPRIAAIPLDISEEELRNYLVAVPHSRFPVYQGDLDHIVGLLLTKDFVRQQLEQPEGFDLRALLRHIPAIPEAMTCDRLLVSFKRSHVHMALVFDEYGGTAGVVTLEDLVEEVVGKVHDEFEQVEPPPLREIEAGIFLARGDLLLDDLYKIVPAALPEYDEEDGLPDVDTVGGLVVSLLGRPAQPGDLVEMQGITFIVEGVSGYAVEMVRIELRVAMEEAAAEGREQEQKDEPAQEHDREWDERERLLNGYE
jgi:CBS domain containing-hemolysin-like protein